MYDQILGDALFIMLYAVVAVLAALGSCYLLFRRGNAFAADVTPPLRLRRWTAALLAAAAVNHLWYMPILFLSTEADIQLCDLIGGLLDSMSFFPLSIVVMITMLQDRRRPLWPIAVAFAPLVMLSAWSVINRSYDLPLGYAYCLLLCVGLFIYMVRETWRYSRWLRENYADLEHKEVWKSFVVLAIILLGCAIYVLDVGEQIYEYATEVINIVLICYLLWRVETLSDLSIKSIDDLQIHDLRFDRDDRESSAIHTDEAQLSMRDNIGPLLKQHCEEPQLYLQYDLTLSQLARTIGTNRLYLSQHFSSQGLTYNAYINGLRIQHFINLYHAAAANHQPISVQQLAYQSGFRSYSTFNAAFKQSMEMTATEWMRNMGTSES